MLLNVRERLIVLNLLRQSQGDIVLIKVVRKAIDDVGFDKDELKKINLRFDPLTGETQWNEGDDNAVSIEFDEVIINLIASKLKEMNKAGKITIDYADIWDLFVGE